MMQLQPGGSGEALNQGHVSKQFPSGTDVDGIRSTSEV